MKNIQECFEMPSTEAQGRMDDTRTELLAKLQSCKKEIHWLRNGGKRLTASGDERLHECTAQALASAEAKLVYLRELIALD